MNDDGTMALAIAMLATAAGLGFMVGFALGAGWL